MSGNPVVEFGLCALSAAMAARVGTWTAWDVVRLHSTVLRCVPEDAAAREMVVQFGATVRGNAMVAGATLQAAVWAWLDMQDCATQAEMEQGSEPGWLYDWQQRADLQ